MNGLTIGADWISFTVSDSYTPNELIDFMGFLPEHFRNMPNGANGYKHMLKHENISILYDGAEHMGVHVNITGSSVATLLEAFQRKNKFENPYSCENEILHDYTLSIFCERVLHMGHFSRFDIALDDFGANYYTTDDILLKLENGCIISKWRKTRNDEERVVADNEKVGHTIYLGSRKSDILLRIYDKKLEHNKSLTPSDDDYYNGEWVRWELELHKERADKVAELLSNGLSLGEVAIGVLSNYFRIVELDNNNKSRCTSETKWQMLIENAKQLKITVVKEIKTLEEEIKQWEHQNGRKVAKILYALGGDADYFPDLATRYACRLTTEDREQLGLC